MPHFAGRVLLSGTTAGLLMAAVLAGCARRKGYTAVQPLNATSHWLDGGRAARTRQVDLAHTLPGVATHLAASIFWAGVFEAARRRGPRRPLVGDTAGVAALAAFVDYAVVPKRLTPGWEDVVGWRDIALAYAAMAIAFAATGESSIKRLRRPHRTPLRLMKRN
ncbi:hypothetical protein [Ancylobacter mangrovi]|uniref:hypothetical protein n=1 Tax=Ancylobacter mangrovi TaxID=2972472 RepID=UPI00216396DB|nr:hypothetical protein [Ancylobacter mangrovi]MCS0501240.1 hypothetical protein [Ancylobacter mangrovi]